MRQLAEVKFRRLAPLGQYIVDFVSFEIKLIVELDGGQHVEREACDRQRILRLESQGFRVLRFWNGDVFKNTDKVLEVIWRVINGGVPPPPTLTLPHKGGGNTTVSSGNREFKENIWTPNYYFQNSKKYLDTQLLFPTTNRKVSDLCL